MKRYLAVIATSWCLFSVPSAFAGSGTGLLAHWVSDPPAASYQWTNLWLTNITTHSLTVTLTFYQSDGTVAPTSAITYHNFISSNTQLAAGTSGYVTVNTSSYQWGRAVVTWQNTGSDNDSVGLIGHAEGGSLQSGGPNSIDTMQLNAGAPF